jgi:hypothetical protein
MKNKNTMTKQIVRGLLLIACSAALGLAFTVAQPQATQPQADRIVVPPVPTEIEVPVGFDVFLVGHGVGTQNYICLPSLTGGVSFQLFTPEATLFNDNKKQLITHFFGPNPDEGGVIRVAWEDSRDSSTVWGEATHVATVTPGAIPWLRVDTRGTEPGPTGGDRLTKTRFIQRVNTVGGVAPATGCTVATDIGKKAFVPYKADYFFYERDYR